MEIVVEIYTESPVCKAAQLAKVVDEQLNKPARQEAAAATSATQESGADLGEGSAYLDGSTVTFNEQSVACGLCQGTAILFGEGSVSARKCLVSGSCELEWAERYPDKYKDGVTAGLLVCGAEVGCTALLAVAEVNGSIDVSVQRGACKVMELGINWRERCKKEIDIMKRQHPRVGFEKFDGAGSDREETELIDEGEEQD